MWRGCDQACNCRTWSWRHGLAEAGIDQICDWSYVLDAWLQLCWNIFLIVLGGVYFTRFMFRIVVCHPSEMIWVFLCLTSCVELWYIISRRLKNTWIGTDDPVEAGTMYLKHGRHQARVFRICWAVGVSGWMASYQGIAKKTLLEQFRKALAETKEVWYDEKVALRRWRWNG